jgi:primosomal protein DnaI
MEKVNMAFQEVDKNKLVEDLFDSPFLHDFFIDHDLDSDFIEENLLSFISYNNEKALCSGCDGLSSCRQKTRGIEPVLRYRNKKVIYNYQECKYLKARLNEEDHEKYIDAMHLPSNIFTATLDDFDFERGLNKMEVLNKMTSFITLYKNGQKPKGLYLHGRNNVGKTYALSALANELMKNNINVVIAYYPDLVREFKSRVADNSVEELISKLKQVEVLMLDDIGGEGKSVWVRDEVLGPILQYRLLDNKPTFFSSNLSIKSLAEEHFSKFTNVVDKVSGGRIGVRIKNLVGDNEINL